MSLTDCKSQKVRSFLCQTYQVSSLIIFQPVLLRKVLPDVAVEKVGVVRGAGPAPALVVAAVLVLDVQALVRAVLVHPVRRVLLDVGVDDRHELPSLRSQILGGKVGTQI